MYLTRQVCSHAIFNQTHIIFRVRGLGPLTQTLQSKVVQARFISIIKKNTNKIFGGVIGQYQVTHEEQILKKTKQIYFKNLVIKQSKKNKKPTLNNLGLKSSSPW